MTGTRHIGGSILPSSDPSILAPIDAPFGRLQVRALPDLDTHALFWAHDQYDSLIAIHPNGYSCHQLAKRMVAGDEARVRAQAAYLLDCGGLVMKIDSLVYAMRSHLPETA